MITVTNQAELDKAIETPYATVHVAAKGRFSITKTIGRITLTMVAECSVVARENSSVVARENSSVEAWGNSSVVAWGNSSVVARENSSVVARENSSVEARENSSVEAWGNSSVEAWGNSSVVAWGNSSVVARENSSVVARENSSVEARENSSVEARENSSVEAWGNSSVEARGHVFIRLWSALKVKASALVIIAQHGKAKNIDGGRVLDMPAPKNAKEWCDFYGVEVKDGVAILYKAVRDDFKTSMYDFPYIPGTVPVAPDWDGGKEECGGGLHFSPTPRHALAFHTGAKTFVGCPVALKDIAKPHKGAQYPEKCKAKGCCGPVFAVDRNGKPVEPAKEAA
jgi:hypothetical protein